MCATIITIINNTIIFLSSITTIIEPINSIITTIFIKITIASSSSLAASTY
ncbi:hypothetical protein DPMN_171739 [Dreissena polymorpha]|uniref:Uncharacterized protein n=1 Tax=Dreissena polymorpha TaxID=45954 RepID=A0A9D4IFF1_DREPO|nr:hypothetical protein DPMN_171739 [Dreissena polymorpha]